jgi:NAD+ kinase
MLQPHAKVFPEDKPERVNTERGLAHSRFRRSQITLDDGPDAPRLSLIIKRKSRPPLLLSAGNVSHESTTGVTACNLGSFPSGSFFARPFHHLGFVDAACEVIDGRSIQSRAGCIMTAECDRWLFVVRDRSERLQRTADDLLTAVRQTPGVVAAGPLLTDEIPPGLHGFEDVSLVVAVGGDGTILRTCRQMGTVQRPVLGVNRGKFGFLTDLSPHQFRHQVPALVMRQYRVIDHLMFICTLLRRDGQRQENLGLNEVAVLAGRSLQMLHLELAIDGDPVTTYAGDGLIVSTPVGSTAHSLAAGGPILRQDLQAFVITPISPHTLTNRPLVDRADAVYTLRPIEARDGVTLVIDGQIKTELLPGDVIEIRRAEVRFRLARLPGHNFYRTLHRKLGWGGQPHYESNDE